MNWICKYCGGDTSGVDLDYLINTDHLSCVLSDMPNPVNPKRKIMKIKGWDKISGFTYKGMCIVNPIHNADETKYMATILNLNLPQKPKWELSVLTDEHKFKHDDCFHIILRNENNISSTTMATKEMMKSLPQFRMLIETMIDEILKIELTSAPISHSINVSSNSGILSAITTNSNTITWDTNIHTNLPSSMVTAMQDLQKQIDKLTKQ